MLKDCIFSNSTSDDEVGSHISFMLSKEFIFFSVKYFIELNVFIVCVKKNNWIGLMAYLDVNLKFYCWSNEPLCIIFVFVYIYVNYVKITTAIIHLNNLLTDLLSCTYICRYEHANFCFSMIINNCSYIYAIHVIQ